MEILVFASLISAVDPVAVLSIFAEVGVNPDLYFLVFGESILNDGVAVVLYNMMSVFAGMEAGCETDFFGTFQNDLTQIGQGSRMLLFCKLIMN